MLFSKTLHTISRRRAHYSKRREMILLHRKLTHTPGLIRSSCKMAQVALGKRHCLILMRSENIVFLTIKWHITKTIYFELDILILKIRNNLHFLA